MAFQFQIHQDLQFHHDEKLLAKADENRPEIHHREYHEVQIVELIEDETKLNGCGIRDTGRCLTDYAMKRDDRVILDFGQHIVGTFQINIRSVGSPMDAPLYMRLRFAEMPCELKTESADYDGWLSRSWIQEEYVHLDELPATLKMPRRYSFRYVEITVIDTSPKWQAVFENPVAISQTAADDTRLKPVHLADPQLQRIYDVGVRTLADCMQDVFEDGTKRDRRLWLGDLRLQAKANYVTFDQENLVRRCLCLFAGMTAEDGRIPANVFVKPQVVPDDTFLYEYSLFFISTLHDYNEAHPDPDFARELFPVAQAQMDIALSMCSEDGRFLPDEEYPVFVDWSAAFNKDTAGHAETIYVLRQFVALGHLLETDMSRYEAALQKMIAYAKEHLFHADRELFVTGQGEYNIASQVWMVLAHVMDDETNHRVMECMIQELFPIRGITTPYMYHHIVEALFEAGLKGEAVQLMKNYWGKMVDLGADTFWEAFDPDHPEYSPYGSPIVNSYCHAWSCTPVYLIQKYLL